MKKPDKVKGNWAPAGKQVSSMSELAYPFDQEITEETWDYYVTNKPPINLWDFLWTEEE